MTEEDVEAIASRTVELFKRDGCEHKCPLNISQFETIKRLLSIYDDASSVLIKAFITFALFSAGVVVFLAIKFQLWKP